MNSPFSNLIPLLQGLTVYFWSFLSPLSKFSGLLYSLTTRFLESCLVGALCLTLPTVSTAFFSLSLPPRSDSHTLRSPSRFHQLLSPVQFVFEFFFEVVLFPFTPLFPPPGNWFFGARKPSLRFFATTFIGAHEFFWETRLDWYVYRFSFLSADFFLYCGFRPSPAPWSAIFSYPA